MLKVLLLVWLSVSFWCVDRSIPNYRHPEMDSVFISWNKATFQSLERKSKLMPDSVQRAAYENRASVFEEYLSIKNLGDVNNKSIRYRFLDKVFLGLKDKGEFFIIEANTSGAMVQLRNFVVYPYSTNDVHIDIYLEGLSGWFKKAEIKNLNCSINDLVEGNILKVAHGVNNDDIIVTKFERNKVKYSEYILYGTLSTSSSIKEILNTDNAKKIK